jgi:hypothetical protein
MASLAIATSTSEFTLEEQVSGRFWVVRTDHVAGQRPVEVLLGVFDTEADARAEIALLRETPDRNMAPRRGAVNFIDWLHRGAGA